LFCLRTQEQPAAFPCPYVNCSKCSQQFSSTTENNWNTILIVNKSIVSSFKSRNKLLFLHYNGTHDRLVSARAGLMIVRTLVRTLFDPRQICGKLRPIAGKNIGRKEKDNRPQKGKHYSGRPGQGENSLDFRKEKFIL
jgi:hypothetical protein